jgi:hypothetical protein
MALCSPGCTPAETELLVISSEQYPHAFLMAIDQARREGYVPALRDQRAGIIETQTVDTGSMLEPWRDDHPDFDTALENTLVHQRRRLRIEFTPRDTPPDETDRDNLAGPDLLAADDSAQDLTIYDGPLEMRVWAYLERAHTVGWRRDTWSRRLTTRAQVIDPQTGLRLPPVHWQPISRDPVFERRFCARIEQLLGTTDQGAAD